MRHSQVLRKSTKDSDLDLKTPRQGDAKNSKLTECEVARFDLVTSLMFAALDPINRSKMPDCSEKLSPSMRAAFKALYMAYTAKGMEHGEPFLSGLERKALLNQALRDLWPVLVLGSRPDFPQGRERYEELAKKVAALRVAITWAILEQVMPKAKKQKKQDDDPAPVADAGADVGNPSNDATLEQDNNDPTTLAPPVVAARPESTQSEHSGEPEPTADGKKPA